MKKNKTAAAAIEHTAQTNSEYAADETTPTATETHSHNSIPKAADVEAGSNIAPASQSTGQSMNDAFDVHKLVAGEWS